MMPAAKHFDPIMGIDVHIIQPPGPVPPVPIPHPFVGLVFDAFDYVPIVGSTVSINGLPCAVAGSEGKQTPGMHFPIGGTFIKPPTNESEMFMGSATVTFDGEAASFLALPALSCQDIGMVAPFRSNPKKKAKLKSLVLPTSVVVTIPGLPVLVGGPPTISMQALAMKIGMSALGKGLKKIAKSKAAQSAGKAFKKARQKVFKNVKPGFIKCKVLRAEPVGIVTGEVVVEQKDFEIPGRIPFRWTRVYNSQSTRTGVCGYGWETPADARLEFQDDGTVVFFDGNPGSTLFPSMPSEGPVMEFVDGALLERTSDELVVRTKDGLVYHFSQPASGQKEVLVRKVSDRCGNHLIFQRDENGLRAIKENAGRWIEVSSIKGRINKMQFHHPDYSETRLLAKYEYEDDDLIIVYDAYYSPYHFFYTSHHLRKHTNRNGLSFYYEYDPMWRCIHSYGDGGLYDYSFSYHEGETRITDSLGNTSSVFYDELLLPTKEIDALGGVTLYEYDYAGRTSAVVDPDGHRTEYIYDERGNLAKLIRPDGKVIFTEFNEDNKPLRITDPNGAVWQQEWDTRGLLIKQITPLNARSFYKYDASGQLVEFCNPLGARSSIMFDAYGHPTNVTDSLGHTTEFAYDMLGKITVKIDPSSQCTLYSFDLKGRLVQTTLPSGEHKEYSYDQEDNLVRYQNENGDITLMEYSGLGEIKRLIQPEGHRVEYEYDTEERLIGIFNQCGERFTLNRDALGRIVEEIDYWGQRHKYVYSLAGHLRKTTDPLRHVIRYQTDALGRIIKKFIPDSERKNLFHEETFVYDANSNLIACENESIRITRKFDMDGHMIEERQGDDYIVNNTYDPNGNRITRTTTLRVNGEVFTRTVHYRYDVRDQVISVEIKDHSPLQLTRDAYGRVTEERLGTHLWRHNAYSPNGFLTSRQVVEGTRQILDSAYSFDNAGNIIEKRDSLFGVMRYAYDPLGRLTEYTSPEGHLKHYVNNLAGNLLTTRESRHNREINSEQEYAREGELDGTFYHFNHSGNLVLRSSHEQTTHFFWDANKRLRKSSTNGACVEYQYDPLGRRISKETANIITKFYWDGDALLGDIHFRNKREVQSPVRLREWVYYPETFEPFLMFQDDITWKQEPNRETSSLYVYHNEPNGCPIRLLEPEGKVMWAALYDTSGSIEQLQANIDNPLRLLGQYYDEETGLHYNRYRYYDPASAQFITPDSLGVISGVNLYSFGPSTLNWIDPFGFSFFRGARAGEPPSFVPRPNEYKVRNGLVQPTHGVSVFNNPDSLTAKGFEPHEIDMGTVPDSLQIIQRGQDPKHFEIVPKQAMPEEEYKTALDKIKTLKKGCG